MEIILHRKRQTDLWLNMESKMQTTEQLRELVRVTFHIKVHSRFTNSHFP